MNVMIDNACKMQCSKLGMGLSLIAGRNVIVSL